MNILYRCWCKATQNEAGHPRYSLNWAVSRRAHFIVYEDRVECGDWSIPIPLVEEATIYHTRQLFIPVNVLELKTRNGTFQFGFNPWADPFKYLKLDFKEERVKLKMSFGSILARILILIGLYILLSEFFFK